MTVSDPVFDITQPEGERMTEQFSGWAIVELMGHRRIAGLVGEQQIAGSAFLRVDVPDALTQFYAPSAVYCITPTDEATARKVAAMGVPRPVQTFELESADGEIF